MTNNNLRAINLDVEQSLDQALKYYSTGKYTKANKVYSEILAVNPIHPTALHFLGLLAYRKGRVESAVSLIEKAISYKCPYILFTCSGGARMQEGIISLMQMPRTVAAVELLNKNKTPYIVILTEPTTGGVTASFAMLGDITIAEMGSTIGFAGKRVIQDTIREELPIDFQKAEYLYDHGMVDIVVHRKDLKNNLQTILNHIS